VVDDSFVTKLCRIDRKKRYSTDWHVTHAVPLQLWEQRQRMDPDFGPIRQIGNTREYLRWYYSVARVSIKPARNNDPTEDRPDTGDEDDIIDEYDDLTRAGVQPERAPLQNYIVSRIIILAFLLICIGTRDEKLPMISGPTTCSPCK
jgi:hypothetical protein